MVQEDVHIIIESRSWYRRAHVSTRTNSRHIPSWITHLILHKQSLVVFTNVEPVCLRKLSGIGEA